jgi:hypothetical protein
MARTSGSVVHQLNLLQFEPASRGVLPTAEGLFLREFIQINGSEMGISSRINVLEFAPNCADLAFARLGLDYFRFRRIHTGTGS